MGMKKKYKVVAVSYLNTKPLLWGLLNTPEIAEQIELTLAIPSVCAAWLQAGEADLGLVPVAILPELENAQILSDYCIGAVGKVATVCIFSHVPIEKITHLYLDYHSRTSVELAQILLREYWKITPTLLPTYEGFEEHIGGTQAAVIIGDRAIMQLKKFEYVYDLAEIWQQHTRLPFVFAAWVSQKTLPDDFIAAFNAALARGIAEVPKLMYILPSPAPFFDLEILQL